MSNSVKGIDEELASKKMKKKTFFEKKLELLSTIREVHP